MAFYENSVHNIVLKKLFNSFFVIYSLATANCGHKKKKGYKHFRAGLTPKCHYFVKFVFIELLQTQLRSVITDSSNGGNQSGRSCA